MRTKPNCFHVSEEGVNCKETGYWIVQYNSDPYNYVYSCMEHIKSFYEEGCIVYAPYDGEGEKYE